LVALPRAALVAPSAKNETSDIPPPPMHAALTIHEPYSLSARPARQVKAIMASRRIISTPALSPAWKQGQGPLAVLPALLFRDRQAWLAILTGWLLAIAGSTALSLLIAHFAPNSAGPDLGDTSGAMKLFLIAGFSPVVETLMMAGILALLLRWLAAWQAVIASAAIWGVLHSLASPLWGVVIWWPFLIFSTLYVTWRPRGFWRGVAIVMTVHILQNLFPALLIVLRG